MSPLLCIADLWVDEIGDRARFLGGAGLTTALTLGSAGRRTALVGTVGEDEAGAEFYRLLAEHPEVKGELHTSRERATAHVRWRSAGGELEPVVADRAEANIATGERSWADETAAGFEGVVLSGAFLASLAQSDPRPREENWRWLMRARQPLFFDLNLRPVRHRTEVYDALVREAVGRALLLRGNETERALWLRTAASGGAVAPCSVWTSWDGRADRIAVEWRGEKLEVELERDTREAWSLGAGDAFFGALLVGVLEEGWLDAERAPREWSRRVREAVAHAVHEARAHCRSLSLRVAASEPGGLQPLWRARKTEDGGGLR